MKMNKEQARSHIQQLIAEGYTYFCPDCFSGLEKLEEGGLFCPNEMCLNEEHYEDDKNG